MSATIPPTTTTGELTPDQLELQRRAREFVENVLMPLELEAEERGGALPEATVEEIKREAIAARLNGGRFAPEYGGQGWSMFEWFLVNEQFGRVTNGLHWHVPSAYNVLMQGTPEQIERYLLPALRGEGGDAYAVTEAEAGSDPGGISSTAVATDARLADQRREVVRDLGGRRPGADRDGQRRRRRRPPADAVPVEPAAPGVEYVDNPRFTHNYPHGHPTIRFTDVEVGPDAVIGGIGEGEELQRAWFTEERLGIATHGLGAMWRLLDETTAWALSPRAGRAAGSWTTRGSRSRSRTRRPTPRSGGCWRSTSRGWSTPAPTSS